MNYYKEIDILKGIAIVMVLLGHSIIVFPININVIPWCNYLHYLLSSVHMAIFFSVSGYCFCCSDYCTYLQRKIKRILIPYIIFTALNIVCNVLLSSYVNGSRSLKDGIIDGVFYGSEYWFLYTLFIIFLTFPLLVKFAKTKISFIIAAGVLFALKLIPSMPGIFNIDNLFKYYFFFACGYYVKKYSKVFLSLVLQHRAWIAVILMIIWLGLTSVNYMLRATLNRSIVLLLETIDALFGIGFFVVFSMIISKSGASDWLKNVGKVSLPLYLLNGYFLVISRTLACNLMKLTDPILIIAFNMFITFGISYFVIKMIVLKIPLLRKAVGM